MNARDEAKDWAVRYFGDPDEKPEDYAEFADALIAEGWRKMPSREDIADEISGVVVGYGYYSTQIGRNAALEAADAVLALMDGGSA